MKTLGSKSLLLSEYILKKADSDWFDDPPIFSSISTDVQLHAWINSSFPSNVKKAIDANPSYGFIMDDKFRSLALPDTSDYRNYFVFLVRLIDAIDFTVESTGDVIRITLPSDLSKARAESILADLTGFWFFCEKLMDKKKSLQFRFLIDGKSYPIEKSILRDLCEQIQAQEISMAFPLYLLFVNFDYVNVIKESAMHTPLLTKASDVSTVTFSETPLDIIKFKGLHVEEDAGMVMVFKQGIISGVQTTPLAADEPEGGWSKSQIATAVVILAALALIVGLILSGKIQEMAAGLIAKFPKLEFFLGKIANSKSLAHRKQKNVWLGEYSSDDFFRLCAKAKVDPKAVVLVDSMTGKVKDYDAVMPFTLKVTVGGEKLKLIVREIRTEKDTYGDTTRIECFEGVNPHTIQIRFADK
jgi:hypothetical protein